MRPSMRGWPGSDMRIRAHERRQQQSEQERQASLAEMSVRARQRLALESETDREARLNNMRVRARQHTQQSTFSEQSVMDKLSAFHN